VGQGLAGSCLALELLKRNKSFVVIEWVNPNAASRVAAGLFNPITGRTNQTTWRADELFSSLHNFYASAEATTKSHFLHSMPIYRPFLSMQEIGKYPTESKAWIAEEFHEPQRPDSLFDPFGGILIQKSGYLDTVTFLTATRKLIRQRSTLVESSFNYDEVVIDDKIRYQDFVADKIIFCEGCNSIQNPWFNWLPLRKLKGELLKVKGNIPTDIIVNRGVFSVPMKNDEFILGSTYVHDKTDGFTAKGRNEIIGRAAKLFKGTFEFIGESWGHRPTTSDRRPFLGCHPVHKNTCIFNGLGTKGVSLAPFFAVQMADWLEGKVDLDQAVNIERFYSLSFKSK
jgi:glycine/D-amino acid oxidase-like deaminating enzyme